MLGYEQKEISYRSYNHKFPEQTIHLLEVKSCEPCRRSRAAPPAPALAPVTCLDRWTLRSQNSPRPHELLLSHRDFLLRHLFIFIFLFTLFFILSFCFFLLHFLSFTDCFLMSLSTDYVLRANRHLHSIHPTP